MMETKKVALRLFIPRLRGQMSYVRAAQENYYKHYPKSPCDDKMDEGNNEKPLVQHQRIKQLGRIALEEKIKLKKAING